MTSKREFLSTEIVNCGVIEDSGPYASSLSFSVRVRRSLPDFLNSVNLKYVKLGYGYLLSYGIYFAIAHVLMLILSVGLAKKLKWKDLSIKFDLINYIYLIGLLHFFLYAYFHFTPPSTYLIDFACYRPQNELKISKEDFIELARKSKKFDEATIEYQKRVLMNSGMGDETYLPRIVFNPDHKKTLRDGREEAAMVMYGAVDQLLAATQICLKEIKILIVNCGVLNTTPSLSAMVINHYKLNQNIESFNLGGMGCAAGIIAIDLAKDLLAAYLGSYALVISTEVINSTWYDGKERDMLLPNCFFRMGAAAVLLSNHCHHRWRAKYELKQVVCTHSGMDNKSFKSIYFKEDSEGKQGLSINKDAMEVGGHALKANITTLGPLVLSVPKQFHFLTSLVFKNKSNKPYIPNYKLAFEHVCILATSKKVLDEIQKNLELTDEYMEASMKTLERFGNTSSSSVWYELAYLEANSKLKKGDRIWQVGFGSGFKCNSAVWKALKDVKGKPKNNPWLEDSKN